MENKYYLMIKEHRQTGLKYLCQTYKNNPLKYNGSGKYWLRHINKNGDDIKTTIIGTYNNKEDLREWGIYYSKLYNVVESDEWANLTIEQGTGGWINDQTGKNWKISDIGRENMSKAREYMRENHPDKWEAMYKKKAAQTKGLKNYQCDNLIITPWGKFETKYETCQAAIEERRRGNKNVISDAGTLTKYLRNLDVPLNPKGAKTPKLWRGKTPRELGFNWIDIKGDSNE